MTIADALGGRWSWNLTGWAVMLIPGALVVAVQESSLLPVSAGLLVEVILVSSAAQSVAAGLVNATIARLARRWRSIIPPTVLLVMWLAIGVVRGVTGGAVAQALTGTAPQFESRISAWIVVSVVWMPLFVFTAAHIERRRLLLTALRSVRDELEREELRARLSGEELRDSILVTVKERIRPVIEEIGRSLLAVSGDAADLNLELIRRRLSAVAADADTLMLGTGTATDTRCPALDRRSARASIVAALQVELRHPARTALLSAAAILPAVLPIALAPASLDAALDTVVALAIVVTLLYLTAIVRRRLSPDPRFADGAPAIVSYLLAGTAGACAIVVQERGSLSPEELIIVLLLPIGTVISGGCVALATGIGASNRDLRSAVLAEQERLLQARRRSAIRDARVHEQLTALMHGPVQGRLSACVMALNFHLGSKDRFDPGKTATVTQAVVKHLAAASQDLDGIPAFSFGGREAT